MRGDQERSPLTLRQDIRGLVDEGGGEPCRHMASTIVTTTMTTTSSFRMYNFEPKVLSNFSLVNPNSSSLEVMATNSPEASLQKILGIFVHQVKQEMNKALDKKLEPIEGLLMGIKKSMEARWRSEAAPSRNQSVRINASWTRQLFDWRDYLDMTRSKMNAQHAPNQTVRSSDLNLMALYHTNDPVQLRGSILKVPVPFGFCGHRVPFSQEACETNPRYSAQMRASVSVQTDHQSRDLTSTVRREKIISALRSVRTGKIGSKEGRPSKLGSSKGSHSGVSNMMPVTNPVATQAPLIQLPRTPSTCKCEGTQTQAEEIEDNASDQESCMPQKAREMLQDENTPLKREHEGNVHDKEAQSYNPEPQGQLETEKQGTIPSTSSIDVIMTESQKFVKKALLEGLKPQTKSASNSIAHIEMLINKFIQNALQSMTRAAEGKDSQPKEAPTNPQPEQTLQDQPDDKTQKEAEVIESNSDDKQSLLLSSESLAKIKKEIFNLVREDMRSKQLTEKIKSKSAAELLDNVKVEKRTVNSKFWYECKLKKAPEEMSLAERVQTIRKSRKAESTGERPQGPSTKYTSRRVVGTKLKKSMPASLGTASSFELDILEFIENSKTQTKWEPSVSLCLEQVYEGLLTEVVTDNVYRSMEVVTRLYLRGRRLTREKILSSWAGVCRRGAAPNTGLWASIKKRLLPWAAHHLHPKDFLLSANGAHNKKLLIEQYSKEILIYLMESCRGMNKI